MSDSSSKPPSPKPPPRPSPSAPAPAAAPPRLERVPPGYRPPPVVAPVSPPPASPPAASPPAAASRPPAPAPAAAPAAKTTPPQGPPPPQPPARPAAAPGASYGLAAREVGAEAALAAGLALEGALAKDSGLRLFALAAANRADGRLTLRADGRAYALFFRKGTVEHASGSDPAESLAAFLLKKGVLRPEQLAQAEAARPAAGGDLAGALVATRLVNPADVAGLLQQHGVAIVARALALEAGEFAWEPGVAPPPSSFPLGAPFAALGAAIRALDAAALRRRLGDREGRSVSRVAGRIRPEDLHLTPQEARAAALFDGARSPAELAATHPADALTVLRVALLLGELELASFGAPRKAAPPPSATASTAPAAPAEAAPVAAAPVVPTAPRPTGAPTSAVPPAHAAHPAAPARPAAAAPSPATTPAPRPATTPAPRPATTPSPRPATTPAATPSVSYEPAALHALLARHREADHFALLGVKREAPLAQIKVAYFQLAKVYHPDAVPPSAPPEVRKLCADVFAKVSEAWGVLGDDATRAKYADDLRTGANVAVDVMNILRAEDVFQHATLLVKARSYDEALGRFTVAMNLNPDEPEFGVWKAWCEFLLATDKKRAHAGAAAAIEAGLKKNPRCVPGYLFLGQMAKIVGDLGAAEKHLKRGLQVAPEHADLQRELKYLRK